MIQLFPAGYLFLPVGFVLFLLGRKYLLLATVCSVPLIEVLLVNFPGYNMNLPQFLIILLVIRAFLNGLLTSTYDTLTVNLSTEKIVLVLFVVLALVSLTMPMIFAKGEPINPHHTPPGEDSYPRELRQVPLELTSSNITQLLYLVFFTVSFWIFTVELDELSELFQAARFIVVAGLILAASGTLYQLWVSLGLESLGTILQFLNPNLVPNWWARFSLPMLFSLAGEPGPTGHFLLIPAAFIFIPVIRGNHEIFWSPKVNYLILVYFLTQIMLAGTTGYVGIIIFLLAHLLLSFRRSLLDIVRPTIYIISFFFIFVLTFNYISEIPFLDYVEYAHIEKLGAETGSGYVRIKYALWSWELATKYPLLGVGWGSHRAPSLFPVLLSNSGFVGVTVFLLFNGTIVWKTFRKFVSPRSRPVHLLCLACLCAFAGVFVSGAIARPIGMINSYSWYPFLLAVMSRVSSMPRENHHDSHDPSTSSTTDTSS